MNKKIKVVFSLIIIFVSMTTGCISSNKKPRDEGEEDEQNLHLWGLSVLITNPNEESFYLYIPHPIWRNGTYENMSNWRYISVENNTYIKTENTRYGYAINLSSSEKKTYLYISGRKIFEDENIGDSLTLTLSSVLNYSNLYGSIMPRRFWIYSNYSIIEQKGSHDSLDIDFSFEYGFDYKPGPIRRSVIKDIWFQDNVTIGSGWKEIPCHESSDAGGVYD